MTKLVIYDPPMCCSTGVCGPAVIPISLGSRLTSIGLQMRECTWSVITFPRNPKLSRPVK